MGWARSTEPSGPTVTSIDPSTPVVWASMGCRLERAWTATRDSAGSKTNWVTLPWLQAGRVPRQRAGSAGRCDEEVHRLREAGPVGVPDVKGGDQVDPRVFQDQQPALAVALLVDRVLD